MKIKLFITGGTIDVEYDLSGKLAYGATITAVQILDKGVFVTMNGKVFRWGNIQKNFDLSEFQEKH